MFLAKTCIVLLVVAGLVGGLVTVAMQSVERLVAAANASTVQVADFVKLHGHLSMDDVVQKAAVIAQDVQALPEERKQSLIRSIGFLSRAMTPVIEAWRFPPQFPLDQWAPTPPAKQ